MDSRNVGQKWQVDWENRSKNEELMVDGCSNLIADELSDRKQLDDPLRAGALFDRVAEHQPGFQVAVIPQLDGGHRNLIASARSPEAVGSPSPRRRREVSRRL